ncbi:histidine-containing phosphotransfer protein 1-like [Pyrus communis]|uniref:histidine-containing phosphotransfer protein 1-like n=1 Tax=Pyrus communis TaxID=23211 RepID=UPI0035C01E0B
MALPELKAQIKILIQSMLHEGMLDYQFTQLQELQNSSNPNFVAEIIKLFCDNTKKVITELEQYLCEDVDFCKLTPFVLQLQGSSSSIGARQITLACADLSQASADKNKEG